jgi:hypothetical protein
MIGMPWCVVNFIFMVGYAMRNGTSAFPDGVRDKMGYFVMSHGRRYDFTETAFQLSYWQGLITSISIPVLILGCFILHANGDIKKDDQN